MPSAIMAMGEADCESMPSGCSMAAGKVQPVRPKSKPAMMLATQGLVSTLRRVLPKPCNEKLPCRAHSMETVTRVHKIMALKAMISATEGIASSPKVTLASGRPSRTLLEKIPPSAKTDCATPSRANSFQASRRPSTKTTRQPPKKAIIRRVSTGGSF